MTLRRISLFGIDFADGRPEDALAAVESALRGRERGYVVTPNVDHMVRLHRDPGFRRAYEDAAFRFADGMPLVWASRLLGRPLRGRMAGSDLLPALAEMAAARGYTIFLLGGGEGVSLRAAMALRARFPVLRVAGVHAPPGRFGEDAVSSDAAIDAVAAARPDILFVGLGSPKQELWVHRHWERLACTVAVCCGAAIDFIAGAQTRAPAWMQRSGLEWLWRLAHNPRRLWRRYLVDDAAFLGIFLKEWWRLRVRKQGS